MFSNISKFKKIILGIISILIMIFSYSMVEDILFITSKRLSPWEYDENMSYKEILVSDFDDGDSLKNNMLELAEKNNINIYFKDYEINNPYYNSTYYYITSQDFLDKLPFTDRITIDEFNNSTYEMTNNDKNKSLDIISSRKFIESISSFKNYKSKRFLGQLLVFGTEDKINKFENETENLDVGKLNFVDFNYDMFTFKISNIDKIVFIAQEFIKNLELEALVVLLLIIIALDIKSQQKKMVIYKLNGYTNFNIFSLFLKVNISIFILSSIVATIPIIILYQEVFNINSFKFLPDYIFITLIITILIFLVTLISCHSLNKINIVDMLYRKKENNKLSIGFLILKILAICILGLNLLETVEAKRNYDLYTDVREVYSPIHKNYYTLTSSHFSSERQVFEAKDKAIDDILNMDGVLYYEINYDSNPKIISANMNYINSLNLSSIDDKKIEINKYNKYKTYIVTKNSEKKLKESIKNSKMLYKSRGLETENPEIIVIDNILMYPQINEYIHGSKPIDDFVITACDKDFLNPANLLFKDNNINVLEEEVFPAFDDYISSNLLKFEKESDFYGNFEKEAKSKFMNSMKKVILIFLIYTIISIYIFNMAFADVSKKLAVNMLLGNPIQNSSIKILLYNTLLTFISVSSISYFLKFRFDIYLKLLIGLVFLDLLSFICNLVKYKNNLISILKSSMEE